MSPSAASASSSAAQTPPRTADQSASLRSTSTAVNSTHRGRLPRSLPPWIDSYEVRHGTPTDESLRYINAPPRPFIPHHQSQPSEPQRRVSKDGYVDYMDGKASEPRLKLPPIFRNRADKPGRKWDHLRSAEPVIMGTGYRPPGLDPYAQWRDFMSASAYGKPVQDEWEVVDPEVLAKLQPGLDGPVHIPFHPLDPKSRRSARRKALNQRVWHFILKHPIVPLMFRLIVLTTSIIALAVAVKIYEFERDHMEASTDLDTGRAQAEWTQAIVAIIIDVIAVPYLVYMTWDEYTGKPLGLRPPFQKIGLTLCDLLFIVFKSASTALAFEALVFHNNDNDITLHLAQALAASMTVGLVSWIANFTVNVFRLGDRLGGDESSRD